MQVKSLYEDTEQFLLTLLGCISLWNKEKGIDQLCGKYFLTGRANEGYVVIFDSKTTVGELCTPQERLVQGKKILIFNIGIGR